MSSLSVDHVFTLRQEGSEYAISFSFPEGMGSPLELRAKPIPEVTRESAFAYYAHRIESQSLLHSCDVQPVNGFSERRLTDTITTKDVEELNSQAEYLCRNVASRVNLFVLDIKDEQRKYENHGQISGKEREVSEFLQADRPGVRAKSVLGKFHRAIRQGEVHFLIREGLLKHAVVTDLSPQQRNYFQNSKEGRGRLCQVCEIVMNLFKMGFVVEGLSKPLHPEEYFLSTRRAVEELPAEQLPIALSKIHRISLKTLYPPFYKDLYGPEEEYFVCLQQIFNARHDYDESSATTIISLGL